MKSKIITLSLFLSLAIVPAARAGSNNFGVKGGMNVAGQSVKYNGDGVKTSSYTGFHAGIFYKIDLPLGLGVQAEALYSRKGSFYTSGNDKIGNRFDYLDIPVYLRWTLGLLLSLTLVPVPILLFRST